MGNKVKNRSVEQFGYCEIEPFHPQPATSQIISFNGDYEQRLNYEYTVTGKPKFFIKL